MSSFSGLPMYRGGVEPTDFLESSRDPSGVRQPDRSHPTDFRCHAQLDNSGGGRRTRSRDRRTYFDRLSTFSIVTWMIAVTLLSVLHLPSVGAEYVKNFKITEGVPIGTRIGFIGTSEPGRPRPPGPPYLVVPSADSPIDEDLDIDQNTGEIRTNVLVDRETRSRYRLSAIPLSGEGENIKVTIEVEDENDNSPKFGVDRFQVELPENAPKDSRRRLPSAVDADLGIFNTQRYDIVSGNRQNAFRLSTQRDKDGTLMLDLIVNGFLDREAISNYTLVIEAHDGGSPPNRGVLTVDVNILDLNDNAPVFKEQRYYATVPENVTVGAEIITVSAVDPDEGPNGEVTYSINRRQSDNQALFAIDSLSGLLTVNKRLDFESRDQHELVVVAKDNGQVSQETTAFITVKITDINDNQPTFNIRYKTAGGRPEVREDAPVGQEIAEIVVADSDAPTQLATNSLEVRLAGTGAEHFGLDRQPVGYSLVLVKRLDREVADQFQLRFEAVDDGYPPLEASLDVKLRILDVNDNAPVFEQSEYETSLPEAVEVGTSVLTVAAQDSDIGENSRITYRIENRPQSHSDWFQIEPDTGLILTRSQVDCETDPEPRIVVIATDNGNPRRSASVTVNIGIEDVNDNEPKFSQTFYNVSLRETENTGKCFLRVHAEDTDCGVSSRVSYHLGEAGLGNRFSIDEDTGEICLQSSLDYETYQAHHLTVVAVDRGGLSSTSMVKVTVEDENDNHPVFSPQEYRATVSSDERIGAEVVRVFATDLDSGAWGRITYSIVEGNKEGLFRMAEDTGVLYVDRSLQDSRGLFRMSVSAEDSGGNIAVSIASLEINIQPNSAGGQPLLPACTQRLYTFSIAENTPVRTNIGQVETNVENPRFFFYPSSGVEDFFEISSRDGVIYTRRRLDHETDPMLLLNIGVELGGGASTIGYCQAAIQIVDVNDNAPSFGSTLGLVTLPENSPPLTLVFAKQATDKDAGDNGRVKYRIINGNGLFEINENTGIIRTLDTLDFEKSEEHQIEVVAYDQGSPSLSTSLALTVVVQDENDHAPKFSQKIYEISVDENLPKDSQILPLSATDRDKGKNGRLKYTILDDSGTVVKYISVLPYSGILYLSSQLDFETRNSFTFTVKVEDEGTPSLSDVCTVKITVVDSNDNPPKFDMDTYRFTVEENTGKNFAVGEVRATDQDSGRNGKLVYRFKSSSDSFRINRDTGEIRSVVNLDREVTPEYNLEVEVVDGGSPRLTSTASVYIQVTDLNDNAPVIVDPLETTLSVREREPVGTLVSRVRALDPDLGEGGSLLYSIEDDGEDGYTMFNMNPTSGEITTSIVLEAKDIYRSQGGQNLSITVHVTDQGSPQRSSKVRYSIYILGENDRTLPFAERNLFFEVAESVRPGTRIGSVKPSEDSVSAGGAGVWFSLVGGNREGMFDIDNESADLVVVKPLDSDSRKEFNLKVSLNDNLFGLTRETIKVKVVITDVNDNRPQFSGSLIELTVSESSVLGRPIHTVRARDIDNGSNGTVRYSLVDQFPETYFRVDSLSGELFLVQELDYETTEKVFLTLRATDSPFVEAGRKTSNVAVVVHIADANDHEPVFVSAQKKELDQAVEVGVPFHRVAAVDADSGDAGRINYVIEGGNTDDTFQLDSSSGLLTVKKQPQRSSYRLTVQAEDSGNPRKFSNQILQISIAEHATGPPKFSQSVYEAEVAENRGAGTVVTTVDVTASTVGPAAGLTYSLDARVAMGLFDIDARSGEILTVGVLDREQRDEYVVTVYVHDTSADSSFDTATVLIKVLDENDNTPAFADSCYPLFVPENTDLADLHYFTAVDADDGQNGEITYSIVDGNTGNKFSVDAHTGQLSASPLDHEEVSAYTLTVKAEDKGNPRRYSTCDVTVRVIDRNDNDPVFAQPKYRAKISENVDIGTKVITVTATDADSGENAKISYSIQNGTEWIFGINRDTGEVYTTSRLDREKNSVYSLLIVAVDEGVEDTRMASTSVTISLEDENDNRPEFVDYPFMAQVLPQHPVGGQILRVEAVDRDVGRNARLQYAFLNSEDSDRFQIDAGTGVISSKRDLQPDDGQMFHIEILVTDGGSPSLSSTGLVEIRVGQQPSVQLNFQQKTYEAEISEDGKVGEDILQVQAVRSDARIQRVIYTFGQGNELGTFEINSNNGLIRLKNPDTVDYETEPEFKLTVIGHAAGQDQLYAYAVCRIRVRDINDNEPRFTQNIYFARAWEGNNKGTFVTQVMAVDGDSIENERLYYQIVDGNHDGAFSIDQQYSGIIKTSIVLDREIRDAYELTVTATDEGSPPKTGYTKVIVKIIDINDNQPQFPQSKPISISEGTLPGTRIGTIQANDIDSHPHLTYAFAADTTSTTASPFTIDKFSGQLSLARPVDRETRDSYQLTITASDGAHTVNTRVQLIIEDENDSTPTFDKQVYTGVFSSNMTLPAPVLTVYAEDNDVGDNGKVLYSLVGSDIGYVDRNGTIFINNTADIDRRTEIHLVVSAEDQGRPDRRQSFVSVRLQNLQHSSTSPQFLQSKYEVTVDSSVDVGDQLVSLEVPHAGDNLFYSLEPENSYVGIDSSRGVIFLKRRIADITVVPTTLDVTLRRDSQLGEKTSTEVKLNLDDLSAGGQTEFMSGYHEVSLAETTSVGAVVMKLNKIPAKYDLRIAAGNSNNTFRLSESEGGVILNQPLDYETQVDYKLVLIRTYGAAFDTLTLLVKVVDENDNAPFFPVSRQIHSVPENSPPGSLVFVAFAMDLDALDSIKYYVSGSNEFAVGELDGRVVTKRTFDYERETEFGFTLVAEDLAGARTTAGVVVKVESVDEFHPAFESPSYKYSIDRLYPAGHILGRVRATDADAGPSGRILYSLAGTSVDGYFSVDADTGEISVARNLDTGLLPTSDAVAGRQYQDVTYVVQASTGRADSLKTSTLVILQVKTEILPPAPLPSTSAGVAAWGQALIIAIVFIILIIGAGIFFFKKFSVNRFIQKRLIDPNSPAAGAGLPYNSSVHDTSTLDSTVPMSQYPPQYSDIVSQYGGGGGGGHSHGKAGQTRPGRGAGGGGPELSEQSRCSASSGRGSAEDGEEEVDHEIQMINGAGISGGLPGGIPGLNPNCLAEDSMSDISVQNGKEYLARLGIDTTRVPHLSHTSSYQTLEGQPDLYNRLQDSEAMSEKNSLVSGNNSVYARTGHPVSMTGSLSSIVHSEEEMAGSYNWDYLLDWGPQYQPLQHVFQEISSLKDEGSLGGLGMDVPPLLTSLPPRHAHSVSTHPRSPVSQEMLAGSALSPSFSPALSPLATRSPSISPLGPLGGPVRGVTRGVQQTRYPPSLTSDYVEAAEKELRI